LKALPTAFLHGALFEANPEVSGDHLDDKLRFGGREADEHLVQDRLLRASALRCGKCLENSQQFRWSEFGLCDIGKKFTRGLAQVAVPEIGISEIRFRGACEIKNRAGQCGSADIEGSIIGKRKRPPGEEDGCSAKIAVG
jgi:hypothetical protein